jgi:hypothetical protein
MRRLTILAIAFLSLAGLSLMAPSQAGGFKFPHAKTILAFKTMYGVDGPFVGDANPIRDVNGDELPWEITKAVGKLDIVKLDKKGHLKGFLKILVRGLVFKDDPSVPPELRGKNDEKEFRGLVSCLTEEGANVVEANVITKGFPATKSGDSIIKAKVELPNPCVAPIIMVLAGSEDKWFAVTGFEAEED